MDRTRAIRRSVAIGCAAALLLTACGNDGTDPADAASADTVDDVTDDPDVTGDDGGDEPVDDAGDESDDGAATPANIEAADGWGELHATDLPGPGTVEITIDGQRFTAEAECIGFGEVPDEAMDGNFQLNEFILFGFSVSAAGRDADDRPFRVSVGRSIHVGGDRFFQIENSGWGGDGQLDIVSFSNDDGVSRQQTPSSADPEGTELKLVRVDPGGGYTAQGELTPEFEGDEAPTGPFTLAGQCQTGWPQDQG